MSTKGATWDRSFESILKKVGKRFGVGITPFHASLSKLVIVGEGSCIPLHTESNTAQFGTLVLVLPCRHTGGELVVRSHDGQKEELGLKNDSICEVKFAAFYSGCEHEAKSVLSGHLVALVYQLVNTDPEKLLLTKTPPENTEVINQIASLLESLLAPETPLKLVYDLKGEEDLEEGDYFGEHHPKERYPDSKFVKEGPKGRDQVLVNVFLQASLISGKFKIASGMVEIEESGREWQREDSETTARVAHLADCRDHSSLGAGFVPLSESEVFESDLFSKRRGDTTHKHTNYEGTYFTRCYKCPAMILWNSSNPLF